MVVYSETILGNPLNATRIIRWILNFPGALGGSSTFPEQDFVLAYTQNIKNALTNCNSVLFLPAVDLDELPFSVQKETGLSLVYAGKYRSFIGSPPKLPGNPKEIFRDGASKLSRQDFLSEIARAEMIYLFENSSVATEAVLMRTVAIFIQNEFLGPIIAEAELGLDGVSIGLEEESIKKAKLSVQDALPKYKAAQQNFGARLQNITGMATDFFRNHPIQDRRVRVPSGHIGLFFHRFRLLRGILAQKGIKVGIRAIVIYLQHAFARHKS
jgi:hypothetical protein